MMYFDFIIYSNLTNWNQVVRLIKLLALLYSKQLRRICIVLKFQICTDETWWFVIRTNLPLSMGIQILGPLLRAIRPCILCSENCFFCVLGRNSNWALTYRPRSLFTSPVCDSHEFKMQPGEDCVLFGGLRTSSLLFADDMVLFASSDCDLHVFWDGLQLGWRSAPLTLRPWFSARKQPIHSLGWTETLHQMKEFNYLWVLLMSNVEFSRRLIL